VLAPQAQTVANVDVEDDALVIKVQSNDDDDEEEGNSLTNDMQAALSNALSFAGDLLSFDD
jgi:hypothetical protein